MKLFGIGTDIVKISRIKKSFNRKKFLSRIFNEKEITSVKKLKIYLIVMLKGLQQKRPFRRR